MEASKQIAPSEGVTPVASSVAEVAVVNAEILEGYKVIRRNGTVVSFDRQKIIVALTKAFLNVMGSGGADSAGVRQSVEETANRVIKSLLRRNPLISTFHIEAIQDQVELALMRGEYHQVARAYVIYREKHAEMRRQEAQEMMPQLIRVSTKHGVVPLDVRNIQERLEDACRGLTETNEQTLLQSALKEMYDGIRENEVYSALFMAARAQIEREPEYSQVSARLLLDSLRLEIFEQPIRHADMESLYPKHLAEMVRQGIVAELLDPKLAERFDLVKLGKKLCPQRDLQFNYLGLQTLYDRYFLRVDNRRLEMPQSFFMRVAMGLAIDEQNPTERAAEFYELLSSFLFMSSTPTLFNSGTRHSQLSSCYLTTVKDNLYDIFAAYQDNAMLAKFAGGLGNDWTPVRAMGAHIKGTNGKSQGVVPFLKIVNDTAVAVNQGGKRKGAVCSYLETWHLDIEEFLELRKNTGDERRRAHDMNTANWVPDLFMKRVMEKGTWTLFSPNDVPDLHDLYGEAFTRAYVNYEKAAAEGKIHHKTLSAVDLWRRMLTMLFETGHPWITFKDACNIRSPQQHVGVVHSSNLCTEITLNTNSEEIAVCNLGSVNLPAHLKDGALDEKKLSATIKTAMRMLDNVIDINYYAVEKAKVSNQRHRPVGLGMMGFQDCLYEIGIPYNSDEAVEFADRTAEALSYEAYWASTELAEERGSYSSFNGSLWSRGILPQDSLRILARERGDAVDTSGDLGMQNDESLDGKYLQINLSQRRDWNALRQRIKEHGMRNSNCVAIAPTATIANIVGVTASIEPTYQNIYVKSNLSGEFTVSNGYLVRDLKKLGIWDNVILEDIKYFDGRLNNIERIPAEIRAKYPTAFEIEPKWLIECAARRQKWIDQAQSLNLYIAQPSGKALDEMYKLAWLRGLKTTYYLRSLGATSTEKYTTRTGALNAVDSGVNGNSAKACSIDDPECESCQ
ncbi:MAG: ribonucleoside-diphosphate reductase subunit alpha [Gammaproteobacteria bacterium WSBS_2016_MAG_OTU1]